MGDLGDSDFFRTFAPMFVRKKKNRTGTISVVVVDKSKGSFKEVKNFGVVSSEVEADVLCEEAHEWINTYGGQQILDFGKTLSQEKKEEVYYECGKPYDISYIDCNGVETTQTVNERLVITYSKERAKKDADNRRRGVDRLRKAFGSGTIKKESPNRRGYNKFLEITKDVGIYINEEKVADDARWDGWKGYITNTTLDAKDVVSQYRGLWVVERAFRITKGNLEVRPVFHFTHRRIEAHICICFIAYKVYKELERIMKLMNFPLSVDKALEIAKTIPTVTIRLPHNRQKQTQTLFLTSEQRRLRSLFDLKKYFG